MLAPLRRRRYYFALFYVTCFTTILLSPPLAESTPRRRTARHCRCHAPLRADVAVERYAIRLIFLFFFFCAGSDEEYHQYET